MLADVLMGAGSSPEAARDMMRELTNMAGGVVVRTAADEGVRVTSGLPVDDDVCAVHDGMVRRWTAEIAGLGPAPRDHGRDRIEHRTLVLAVAQLHEGMVASSDVVDASGLVLVARGTRSRRRRRNASSRCWGRCTRWP